MWCELAKNITPIESRAGIILINRVLRLMLWDFAKKLPFNQLLSGEVIYFILKVQILYISVVVSRLYSHYNAIK